MPASIADSDEDEQLVAESTRIAEEAHAALGVADRHQDPAELGCDDEAAQRDSARPSAIADDDDRAPSRVGRRLQVEAEHVLEIGQAVIAAEAHVVAEEGEQQRIGQRLGDDREIDAGDARAEGEQAEDQGEQARHQHDHRQRRRQK